MSISQKYIPSHDILRRGNAAILGNQLLVRHIDLVKEPLWSIITLRKSWLNYHTQASCLTLLRFISLKSFLKFSIFRGQEQNGTALTTCLWEGGIDVLKSEIVIKEWEDGARKGILQTIVSLTSDHCIGVKMGTEMLALRKGVAVCTVGAAWEKLKKGEWDIESFRSWYSLKYSFGGRCAK